MTVPREHGSWFFVLEPLLLTLPLCHGRASLLLALAAFLAFLARRPLVAAWSGSASMRDQAVQARGLSVVLLTLASLAAIPVLLGAPASAWCVAGLMLGLSVVASRCEQKGWRRSLPGELAGVLAFGLLPALLVLAEGLAADLAVLVPLVLLLRSLPAFLSLRAFLRARKRAARDLAGVLLPPLCAVVLALLGWSQGVLPLASLVFAGIFTLRSLLLVAGGAGWSATRMGISEALLGVLHSLVLAWILGT